MCDPPSALTIADRQQQHQQQRLHHQPHHDNASTNNRRALADFYSTCEHQQRHEAAVTNSILNNTNRGDFQQQQHGRSVNRNVEKTVSSPRGNISSLQSAYGPLEHDNNSQSHPSSCDINSSFIHLQSDRGRNAVVDDLLLLRGGGGGGGCDNRCELNSSSYHHSHHHGHHPHSLQQQQQQQGVAISERSLVLTESRNFTLSPETTDCDSGSWLNHFLGQNQRDGELQVEVLPVPSGILSLSSQRGPCRTLQLQDYTVQEYSLPSPPFIKCDVLRENLSEE
jgi:hypothetical protein